MLGLETDIGHRADSHDLAVLVLETEKQGTVFDDGISYNIRFGKPVAEGARWAVSLSALQTLNRSGIETLTLMTEGREIELSTSLELGGSVYGMLRAQGLVAKDFTLEISAKEWAVCVGGNRYLLTDGELETN